MRIGIPTNAKSGSGNEAPVYGHFGSAPGFVIVDTEKETFEIVENAGKEHEHGHCDPFQSLQAQSVEALITGGIGRRALQLLREQGIKVYGAQGERTAAEAVKGFRDGRLQEISFDDACAHHEGHVDPRDGTGAVT